MEKKIKTENGVDQSNFDLCFFFFLFFFCRYTTTTTTTTVVTSHGTDRPAPAYVAPPHYASSLGLNPLAPRQPPVFVQAPVYPGGSQAINLPTFTLPDDELDVGSLASASAAAGPPPPPYRQPPPFN
jgi:hypothetical protein